MKKRLMLTTLIIVIMSMFASAVYAAPENENNHNGNEINSDSFELILKNKPVHFKINEQAKGKITEKQLNEIAQQAEELKPSASCRKLIII